MFDTWQVSSVWCSPSGKNRWNSSDLSAQAPRAVSKVHHFTGSPSRCSRGLVQDHKNQQRLNTGEDCLCYQQGTLFWQWEMDMGICRPLKRNSGVKHCFCLVPWFHFFRLRKEGLQYSGEHCRKSFFDLLSHATGWNRVCVNNLLSSVELHTSRIDICVCDISSWATLPGYYRLVCKPTSLIHQCVINHKSFCGNVILMKITWFAAVLNQPSAAFLCVIKAEACK